MFADAAGQVAMLSDRMNQFSEVMEAGRGGVLLFKAGLAATAGVIGFEVGKSLGDLIFQTEKFTRQLEAANAEFDAFGGKLQSAFSGRMQTLVDNAVKSAEATNNVNELLKVQATLRSEMIGKEQQLESAIQKKRAAEEAFFQTKLTEQTINLESKNIQRLRSELDLLKKLRIEATQQSIEDRQLADVLKKTSRYARKVSRACIKDAIRSNDAVC